MRVLYFIAIYIHLFSIVMVRLFIFSALRLPVFFLCGQIHILYFIKCRNFDFIKLRTLSSENFLNKHHHFKNKSGRRLSHQLQILIRSLVKQ